MYQSSIRDKKKHKIFNQQKNDNYDLNSDCEEYAYVKKLLGNCRVHLITNSGVDAIGIIRGALKKFSKRVLIETGDIVVISRREYQVEKVDIVHKYNADQVQYLINEKKLSGILSNHYNNMHVSLNEKIVDDEFDFAGISSEDDDVNKPLNVRNPNRINDENSSNSSEDT
jgi:initiation factor 1A